MLRFESRDWHSWVQRWSARVDRVCRMLALGDWRSCPSKIVAHVLLLAVALRYIDLVPNSGENGGGVAVHSGR